jgi:hypothetical protein
MPRFHGVEACDTRGVFSSKVRFRQILPLLLTVLLLGAPCHAQYRGAIQGVVTDAQGGVIPGATLTLTDEATHNQQVRTSNGVGTYSFNALPPDMFTLTIEKNGFQKKLLNGLQIIPEQTNALNIQLEVGTAAQTVTVDASRTPLIDTEGGSIGGTIGSNEIEHMPAFGRDVFQLAALTPGTFGDASQAAGGGTFSLPATKGPGGPSSNGGIFQTENGPQTLANGGQYETNGISIDGIATVSAVWGGTSVVTPTEDSVGNVHIVANGYDAENGRFSGAQIQVTSKSGTNSLHGSAFFQANRPGLNAYQRYDGNAFYNAGAPANRLLLRDEQMYNQYGGSLGGPIWKTRVFAFFAYETERNNTQATATGWYETPAFDALAPSTSIASKFLTFPGAGVSSKGLVAVTCKQAGLIEGANCITIPSQGLNIGSPLKTPLGTQDLTWSSPTSPGVGGGLDPSVADIAEYTTLNPTTVDDNQYNGRIDADVTAKDHASFAIYWVPADQTYYSGPVRAENLWHHSVTNDAFSGIWNHTFSPTWLNEARANAAGWRFNEISSNPQEPFGLPQDSVGALGGPNDNIGGIQLQAFGAPGPGVYNQWTYGYKDVATKVLGRNNIKFGGELTRLYYLNEAPYAARPSFNFFNVWDFLNDAPQAETGTFDPTAGTPTAARQDDREDIWGAFIQDDWKASSSLTLNLGLRYNYFGPLSAKQGNMYAVELGAGSNLLTGLSVHTTGDLWQAQKANFGPEFGFAFSPGVHNRFVIRGGFGMNYNEEEIAISANVYGNPGLTVSPNFNMSSPASANPGIIYAVPSNVHSLFGYPPNPNTISPFGANGLPSGKPVSVTGFASMMPTMYTEHYSLETEFDLGQQWVATAGYQGSLSRHTFFQYDENAVASVHGLPLNPQVNGFTFYGNNGTGNYNAGLAGIRHQFSQQFMVNAQFTWAKSMDTSSSPYVYWYYPYDPGLSYGRSDYNVGRALKLYGMWQPKLSHSGHGWIDKTIGGWSLSGILTVHTGFPWNPVYDTSGPLYCSLCNNYTQLLPGAYLGGAGHSTSNNAYKSGPGVGNGINQNFPKGGDAYFAPPSFVPGPTFPATGGALPQPPGIARNSLTGPGYKDLDGTLSKAFGLPTIPGLGENAKFEFRIDVFNFFNNLNFKPGGQSNGGSIVDNIASPTFGQAQSALGSRTIDMMARFSF